MRIVAGTWRGRTLKSPNWDGLRPTSDRLRETLFNIVGPSIAGARVLDGYSGTGAIGIEALSRGAAHVTFVERDARAVRLIESTLAALGAAPGDRAIIRADFTDAAARLSGEPFDLIIVDPPYAHEAAAAALDAAAPLAGPATRVIVEHASRYPPPAAGGALRLRRTVKAGDSALSFYERA
jgi:16S rRNA (guanine(966)-N(2))-methyltransferase RsmD